MANRYRAEARLKLGEREITLRLTLGALAELEDAFGVSGLAALGERLSAGRISARDVTKLLGVLARGGGETPGEADLADSLGAEELPRVMEAIGACFAGALGEGEPSP